MPTTTRHRWTKEELTRLNRTVGKSKNKTEAFKKIGDEMGIPWQRVRSTYNNHHKPTKRLEKKESEFSRFTDEDLAMVLTNAKEEIERRAELIERLRSLYRS